MQAEITPEVLLRAYACGIFPMAESADDPTLFWVEPEQRGIIPLDGLKVSSRLARTVRSDRFTVTVDKAFSEVIDGCAEPKPGRDNTWINRRIRTLYTGLCPPRPLPQRGGVAGRCPGRRALRRQPRRRVLRREHVPPRKRCLEGGAGPSRRPPDRRRLHPARHPIRHRTPAQPRRDRDLAPPLPQPAGPRPAARRRFRGACRSISRSAAPTRWRSSPRAAEAATWPRTARTPWPCPAPNSCSSAR